MCYILIKIIHTFLTVRSFSLRSISCIISPADTQFQLQSTYKTFFSLQACDFTVATLCACQHAYSNTKLFIRMIMDNSLVSAAKNTF
jgi:hypothetical protein